MEFTLKELPSCCYNPLPHLQKKCPPLFREAGIVSEETGGEELLITLMSGMFICWDDIWTILLPYIQSKDRKQTNDQEYKNDGCHANLPGT